MILASNLTQRKPTNEIKGRKSGIGDERSLRSPTGCPTFREQVWQEFGKLESCLPEVSVIVGYDRWSPLCRRSEQPVKPNEVRAWGG